MMRVGRSSFKRSSQEGRGWLERNQADSIRQCAYQECKYNILSVIRNLIRRSQKPISPMVPLSILKGTEV